MDKQMELRAAAARLMYNNNRDIRDYNALVAFIDDNFREPQTVADQIRGASDDMIAAELVAAAVGGVRSVYSASGMLFTDEDAKEHIEAALPAFQKYVKRPATKHKIENMEDKA